MYTTIRFVLQGMGRLWRLSDCEELVVGYLKKMIGLSFCGIPVLFHSPSFQLYCNLVWIMTFRQQNSRPDNKTCCNCNYSHYCFKARSS